ncbi:MAG: DUF2510 domain-containing protein, partial [Acidimicrobiales bacterium]
MKLDDAPPPGWYPDPEGTGRLRYWEGTDWTAYRHGALTGAEIRKAARAAAETASTAQSQTASAMSRAQTESERLRETDQLVSQMRTAAREEFENATNVVSREISRNIERGRLLVAENVNGILRWMKLAIVLAASLVVIWFVLQFLAQLSFMSWVGDR